MPDYPEILTVARFYVELKLDGSDDRVDAVFMECGGLEVTQAVTSIVEVTPQKWGKQGKTRGRLIRRKIPGNISYTDITLRRGLTISSVMWDWLESVKEGHWDEQQRDGSLIIYNQNSDEKSRFQFARAWPNHYKISDFQVSGNAHAIETVELTVEELKRVAISS